MSDRSAIGRREIAGRGDGDGDGEGEPPRKKGAWCGTRFRRAKKAFLLPFAKARKLHARDAHFYYGDDGGGCCCYPCRRPPPPPLSPPPTPNLNPSSSYQFVKFLIENNDFYSPECNVHGDSI